MPPVLSAYVLCLQVSPFVLPHAVLVVTGCKILSCSPSLSSNVALLVQTLLQAHPRAKAWVLTFHTCLFTKLLVTVTVWATMHKQENIQSKLSFVVCYIVMHVHTTSMYLAYCDLSCAFTDWYIGGNMRWMQLLRGRFEQHTLARRIIMQPCSLHRYINAGSERYPCTSSRSVSGPDVTHPLVYVGQLCLWGHNAFKCIPRSDLSEPYWASRKPVHNLPWGSFPGAPILNSRAGSLQKQYHVSARRLV